MKYSIAIPLCGAEDTEKYISTAKKLGYDGIEPLVLSPADNEYVGMITSLIKKYDIECSGPRTGIAYIKEHICISTEDEAVFSRGIERIKEHIRFASLFQDANVLVGLIQGRLGGLSYETARKQIVKAIKILDAEGTKHDVKIALEPVNRYEIDYHNRISDVIKLLDDSGCRNVGILADSFHMNIEEKNITEALKLSLPRLLHVHVADSNRLAPGQGHIEFDSFFDVLNEGGYNGWITVEANESPSFEIMAEQSIKFLSKYRS